jgi:hypothetical protein
MKSGRRQTFGALACGCTAASVLLAECVSVALAPTPTPTSTPGSSLHGQAKIQTDGCWSGSVSTTSGGSRSIQGCGNTPFDLDLAAGDTLSLDVQQREGDGSLTALVSCGTGDVVTQETTDDGAITVSCQVP